MRERRHHALGGEEVGGPPSPSLDRPSGIARIGVYIYVKGGPRTSLLALSRSLVTYVNLLLQKWLKREDRWAP